MFDALVGSLDWGSGFLDSEEIAAIVTVGDLAGLTVAFVGDGRSNMAHSYLLACATAGMHVRLGAPEAYQPRDDIFADALDRLHREARHLDLIERERVLETHAKTPRTCWARRVPTS